MRAFFMISGTILILIAGGGFYADAKKGEWESIAKEIIEEAKEAGRDSKKWELVAQKTEVSFPEFYPFTNVKSVTNSIASLMQKLEKTPEIKLEKISNTISNEEIATWIKYLEEIQTESKNIYRKLDQFPLWALNESQREQFISGFDQLSQILEYNRYFEITTRVVQELQRKNQKIAILLQNNNEVRSSGGFAGSLVWISFAPEGATIEFKDIYSFDRLVPAEEQLPAPLFFHGLSKKISLRDANFWPEFSQSASTYMDFFESAGFGRPHTILAINLNSIEEILKITGPIRLEKWNTILDRYNFDLVLQFLVESKITGRWSPKAPVELFANGLIQKIQSTENFIQRILTEPDWDSFLEHKNVLAFSEDKELQKLFERFEVDGSIKVENSADNMLYFDFISIGANKSDKFIWSSIEHNSNISQNGTVENTLKAKYSHVLRPQELESILGFESWPINVKNLLDGDLRWKLGQGENRTMLRLWVPSEATLKTTAVPSGQISEHLVGNKRFKAFYIPLNTLPGESTEFTLEYDTKIARGSSNWRPYFLQLVGTPARERTTFLSTISTTKNGRFRAETDNVGRPVPLTDQQFRTVVEFE